MAKKSTRLKGKKWFTLKAPDLFDNKELGEAVAATAKSLKGRKVEVGATDLKRGSNKYYFKLQFKVDEVDDSTGYCKFVGHDSSRDFITRMIRKRSKRIDGRTKVETKDGKKIIVKFVCATIKSVGSSTQTGVRKKISDELQEKISGMSLEKFVNSFLSGGIQRDLKESADEVYPLREIEIRKTEVVE